MTVEILYMSKGEECFSMRWGWERGVKELVESPACQDEAFLLGVQIIIKVMR